jgi:mono/diheme cytochrome c family protein/plastocyanin
MNRAELLSRILITIGILVAIGTPLYVWASTPIIHAKIAADGGWSPDVLQAKVGEPYHLKLTSDDVTHGFAVGGMPMQSVDVLPGKVTGITLTFDKPGTYIFYCTRWCGVDHWRMRGTIEVSGSSSVSPDPATPPLYVTLGLDLDAPHNTSLIPTQKPDVDLVQKDQVPDITNNRSVDYYRSHSPYAAWQNLRATPSLSHLSDQQIWNMVAFLWLSHTSPEAIADGRKLFAQNCAACHGEAGGGNGVFAVELEASGAAAERSMAGTQGMTMQHPADLADPKRMLGASPALLQGKILRGGMGTGMPSWGPIFTDKQTWDLVAYLYSFQFEYHLQGETP